MNTSPTFISAAITSVNVVDTVSYPVATNDADGQAVTLTATVKPDWLSLTTATMVSNLAGGGEFGSADGTGTAATFSYLVELLQKIM